MGRSGGVTMADTGKTIALIKALSGGGGSGGGVLVVTVTDGTLDKTWQEIHDAMLSGGAVIQADETNVDTVLRVYNSKGTYRVISVDDGMYVASSASGYPTLSV